MANEKMVQISSTFNGSNLLLSQSIKTKLFINKMINEKNLHKLKSIWLSGNLEMHKTLYDLDPNITKRKKINKKSIKKKKNGYRRTNDFNKIDKN